MILTLAPLFHASGVAGQDFAPPNFWDQRQRLTQPAPPAMERIRFLTTTNFPPFNFLDKRGRLAGFNVELVREICEELGIVNRCQIEALPFRELVPALERGEGEAIVAGLAATPESRENLAFTQSYFRFPARFVTRAGQPLPEMPTLDGRKVGVVEGSAHAAMLRSFFPEAEPVPFATRQLATDALKNGEIDVIFGDGVALSFWLASGDAAGCCAFSGGPYLSDRFLGEGLAIAVPKENAGLARAFDYAIGQMVADGRFSELMLRYFPIGPF